MVFAAPVGKFPSYVTVLVWSLKVNTSSNVLSGVIPQVRMRSDKASPGPIAVYTRSQLGSRFTLPVLLGALFILAKRCRLAVIGDELLV